ncbi:MAG TPA: polyprenyl synthetase family protein [Armatimonadota bacterium]|jgi:geranylgeranyl diphosphate synthase type I
MPAEIVRQVDGFLEGVLAENRLPPALCAMITYHVGWTDAAGKTLSDSRRTQYGGKKMRAVLCALACEAAGGATATAVPTASAIELIQNFSLVHDDIEDGDRERRHRPTVWVNWGVPQAINTGSAMQALVNAAVLRTSAAPDTVLDLLRALTNAMVQMTEGQHLDIAFQGRSDVTVAEYSDMATRKTGALIEAAAYAGARLATTDLSVLEAWRSFGRSFGRAFQAQDDLLGVVGDPKLTGKPVGNDIRARKKALPLVFACSNATLEDREILSGCLSEDPVSDSAVECITGVMERSGAIAATRAMVEECTSTALAALAVTGSRGRAAQRIRDIVLKAVGRER